MTFLWFTSNTKLCHNRFYEAAFPELINSIKTTKKQPFGVKGQEITKT